MTSRQWVCRFASRDGDRRSAVWRCFVEGGKSDIYLGTRSTLRAIKVSLHESGEWHVAHADGYFTRKRLEGFFEGKPERWIYRWDRPASHDCRFFAAFRVVMPSVSVTSPVRPSEESKAIAWLDAPPVPLANHVALVIVPQGADRPALGTNRLVGETVLPSGDSLLLIGLPAAVPSVPMPRSITMRPLVNPLPDVRKLASARTLRGLFAATSEDGVPFFLDVAVAKPE